MRFRVFIAIGLWLFAAQLALAQDLLSSSEHTFYKSGHAVRTGIEVEFSNLTLQSAVKVVTEIFGGEVTRRAYKVKTTLARIKPDGDPEYNELRSKEYVIATRDLGQIIIRPENNMVDDSEIDKSRFVCELITEPLHEHQIPLLQRLLKSLAEHGAMGTSEQNAVSTQFNTEIARGELANVDWQEVLNLIKSVYEKENRKQMENNIAVPEVRKNYVRPLTSKLLKKINGPEYKASARQLFDDVIYRQSLEVLGFSDAWTMDIARARSLLLEQPNPVVPEVVKQTRLRLSSLLMWALPDDPMTKVIQDSGWAYGRPLIEWREFNTDFEVASRYRQVIGLLNATKEFGSFSHDTLMEKLSGVDSATIAKLRAKTEMSHQTREPVIFRYIIGDRKHRDDSAYSWIKKAYQDQPLGLLPFFKVGSRPLYLPGNSVVFHRSPMHRHSVMGRYNVVLINGFIGQALENKYVESLFWNEYAPGAMPATKMLLEISRSRAAEKILADLDRAYPSGWVLKGAWDQGTETQILTSLSNPKEKLKMYQTSDFESYRAELEERFKSSQYNVDDFVYELQKHRGYQGWKLTQLLSKRESAIVQELIPIQDEYRVEVVAGRVLGQGSTVSRYGYLKENAGRKVTQNPEAVALVESYAQSLVNRLPPEMRGMTFAMDIVITKDGQTRMIESNPGGNSGFLLEFKAESVRALTHFLKAVPEMVASGKIHPGLTPEQQLSYLKTAFEKWNVDISKAYPAMTFTNDAIIDPEYERLVDPSRCADLLKAAQ